MNGFEGWLAARVGLQQPSRSAWAGVGMLPSPHSCTPTARPCFENQAHL